MKLSAKVTIFIFTILFSIVFPASRAPCFERRKDQFKADFGYFLYPVYGRIPGLGNGYGGGATIINIFDSDVDITVASITGDVDALGAAILNIHLIPELIIFHGGYYQVRTASVCYNRGNHSTNDIYLEKEIERKAAIGELRMTLWERRIETFLTGSTGKRQFNKVTDEDGYVFYPENEYKKTIRNLKIGVLADITDDRSDPRRGIRLDWQRRYPLMDNNYTSSYRVDDFNITAYIPIGDISTLTLNYLRSDAKVFHPAPSDSEALKGELGLNCSGLSFEQRTRCENVQSRLILNRQIENEFGRATSLGGTQWLRSFPIERFYGAYTRAYGAELRFNLMDERNPFNIVLMKGIKTSVQFAFFAAGGSVADDMNTANHQKLNWSYGTGMRLVFSGAVVRADFATGKEGNEFIFYFDYPWNLFDFTD